MQWEVIGDLLFYEHSLKPLHNQLLSIADCWCSAIFRSAGVHIRPVPGPSLDLKCESVTSAIGCKNGMPTGLFTLFIITVTTLQGVHFQRHLNQHSISSSHYSCRVKCECLSVYNARLFHSPSCRGQ